MASSKQAGMVQQQEQQQWRTDTAAAAQEDQLGPQQDAHHQPQLKDQPQPPRPHNKLLSVLGRNLHLFTFAPLIIISALSDTNLLLAAAICTAISSSVLLLSFCCWRAGVVKVFPKPFDIFNLCLYTSMVPLAVLAGDWLHNYVGLMTNGGNACFMWASILLPCMDNFVMHSVRDRVSDDIARLPLMRRMALLIALTWATALLIMTGGAVIPVVARRHGTPLGTGGIVAAYVLGLGPLVLAVVLQHVLTHVYRKRMMQQYADRTGAAGGAADEQPAAADEQPAANGPQKLNQRLLPAGGPEDDAV